MDVAMPDSADNQHAVETFAQQFHLGWFTAITREFTVPVQPVTQLQTKRDFMPALIAAGTDTQPSVRNGGQCLGFRGTTLALYAMHKRYRLNHHHQ
jgi:hypothetical protein